MAVPPGDPHAQPAVIVKTPAIISAETRPMLKEQLLERYAAERKRIVLDLAGTSHIDSAGLGLLFSLSRQFRERGGLLCLVNARPAIREAFRLIHLGDFVCLHPERPRDE